MKIWYILMSAALVLAYAAPVSAQTTPDPAPPAEQTAAASTGKVGVAAAQNNLLDTSADRAGRIPVGLPIYEKLVDFVLNGRNGVHK